MSNEMLCVRFLGGSRVTVFEAPVPRCGPGEALVRVVVSAICGSELPSYRQGLRSTRYANPGHEVVGIVEATGTGCRFQEGQRVGVQVMSGCGRCRHCARGEFEHCAEGVNVLSGVHCEYVLAPEACLVPLPDDLEWEPAILLCGDTLGTPFRAVKRLGGAHGGETAAVFGCGPIGLGSLLWLRFYGARVIVSEPNAYRRELAERLGADVILDPLREEVVDRVREETGGGADICLDCSESHQTLSDALEAARIHGRVAWVGEKPKAVVNPSEQVIRKELTVVGSWYFTVADFYDQLALFRRGLSTSGLITHRYRIADAQQAYALFASGDAGKVVFQHSPKG